ncbi:hypothetical protein jaqu_09530 [Jannaschia aquimarina]|uniref:Trypsin n=1 Tax=Jannaschia aquimarina TaxID=935700 RepID=A0A0D1CR20_9RHOB|nr:hypothetical protein jaqu_09530 [Jannaschia aquimarina]SNT18678.1 hypothetical protein SAMN05421775_10779 [Jannaschia aquimarina]
MDSFTASRLMTSFSVNGLFIPANSLSTAVVSYTDPALFACEDFGAGNFFISGSHFRFCIRDRYFAVCTAHQMVNSQASPEQFCIVDGSTRKMLSSHSMLFSQEDELDVRVFEFTDIVKTDSLPRVRWWRCMSEETAYPVQGASKVLSVGYPGERNFVRYTDPPHLPRTPVAVWGEMCEPRLSGRLAFSAKGMIDRDPAGRSGSPVFGIRVEDGKPICRWVGVIANANHRLYHFIQSHTITSMIRQT